MSMDMFHANQIHLHLSLANFFLSPVKSRYFTYLSTKEARGEDGQDFGYTNKLTQALLFIRVCPLKEVEVRLDLGRSQGLRLDPKVGMFLFR